MKRLPVAVGPRAVRYERGALGPVALALGLILCTAEARRSLAEETFSPQMRGRSPVASRAIDPVESVGPASKEIWISSDTPADEAVTAPGPQSVPAGGARSPLASRLARLTSPHRAGESSGHTPSTPLLRLSERLKAAQRDLLEDLKQDRGVVTPPKKVDDSTLFHTTAGPAKPATSVFQPMPDREREEIRPRLTGEARGGLQRPSMPSIQPEMQVPPMEGLPVLNLLGVESRQVGRAPTAARDATPLEHPAVDAQATNPSEVPLPESAVRGKDVLSSPALNADGLKPLEVPPSAPLTQGNAPLRHSPLSAPAAKVPQVTLETSVVRSNEPLAMSRAETEAIRPPPRRGAQPVLPAGRPVGTGSEASAQKVVLRVRVAEFDRARARKGSILGLKLSPRPPLLRLLMEEEPGAQPVLLDSMEREDLDSQIGALEHEGVLRTRGQPTLVTASGREAKLLTGGNRVRLASDAGSRSSSASGDLPGGLTLRPVVIGEDHLQLEVTCATSGFGSQASRDGATGSRTTTMRMRPGQTVAIRGLGFIRAEGENHQQRASLAEVLGLGKETQQKSELVLFVTPELIRSGPSLKTASFTRGDPRDGDKRPSWLSNWIAGR